MRIAVISDIHGNQIALDAVLNDLRRQRSIDRIVVAGDLCLNGPRPREVLDTLRRLHCPVLQGNVDKDVADQSTKRGTRKQSIIEWTRDQIGLEGIAYLAALPETLLIHNPGGSDLLVVHANPLDQEASITPTTPDAELERLLGHLPSTVGAVAFGHYHVAYMRLWRHILLVDAGSCGLPRDGDARASYAILTSHKQIWRAEHRRVPYDQAAVIQQLQKSGMPTAERRIKILAEAQYT